MAEIDNKNVAAIKNQDGNYILNFITKTKKPQ